MVCWLGRRDPYGDRRTSQPRRRVTLRSLPQMIEVVPTAVLHGVDEILEFLDRNETYKVISLFLPSGSVSCVTVLPEY